jgi:hypothetical protein
MDRHKQNSPEKFKYRHATLDVTQIRYMTHKAERTWRPPLNTVQRTHKTSDDLNAAILMTSATLWLENRCFRPITLVLCSNHRHKGMNILKVMVAVDVWGSVVYSHTPSRHPGRSTLKSEGLCSLLCGLCNTSSSSANIPARNISRKMQKMSQRTLDFFLLLWTSK